MRYAILFISYFLFFLFYALHQLHWMLVVLDLFIFLHLKQFLHLNTVKCSFFIKCQCIFYIIKM